MATASGATAMGSNNSSDNNNSNSSHRHRNSDDVPPHHETEDLDASMSNDDEPLDAMSETSSLAIDESDVAAMELLGGGGDDLDGNHDDRRRRRPSALPPPEEASSSPCPLPPPYADGFDGDPTPLLLPSTPTRSPYVTGAARSPAPLPPSPFVPRPDGSLRNLAAASMAGGGHHHRQMYLHARFCPAMTKSVRRTTPPPELFDDDWVDLENDPSTTTTTTGDGRDLGGVGQSCAASGPHGRARWGCAASRVEDPEGVTLVAARNEVSGTQLRVLANEPFMLTTDHANWFPALGHSPRCRVLVERAFLPQAIQVEVLCVGYVLDENGDEMMEVFKRRGASAGLGLEHAIYIRVRVGPEAEEGPYEIPVRLFTQTPGFQDEELSWASRIHLRVANVELPAPAQWSFHLDLWQHVTSIARGHEVPLWSARHFELIDRYYSSLAELGQKCVSIVATEMPWAGQQCYIETRYPSSLFEHAVLDVVDGPHGIEIDFQHFDRLVAIAEKHHMAAEIEVFGLISIWRDPANGFDGPVKSHGASTTRGSSAEEAAGDDGGGQTTAASSSNKHVTRPLDSWRIRCWNRQTQRFRYLRHISEVERFITLFHDHCVDLDLIDRVRICADEPSDVSLFYAQMAFLERLGPKFKVKVALNHLDFMNYAPHQVVDFVPLFPLVCSDLNITRQWHAQIRAKQGKFCWYVCCGPQFPNQFVSSPMIEGELMGFLTFFLELDGFLRWNFCLWPSHPWDDLRWRSPTWRVGDMYFVLPGKDGYPVETIRFESMRFAIQSYELLKLAERTLPSAEFQRLKGEISSLIWRTSGFAEFGKYLQQGRHAEDLYSMDPADYEKARGLVINALHLATVNKEPSGHGVPDLPIKTTISPKAMKRHSSNSTSPRGTEDGKDNSVTLHSPRKRSFRGT